MTTLQEKIAVMQHFADGGEIEFDGIAGWDFIENPTWNWMRFNYRIAITKPSINWDHVSEKYNYLAIDGDGNAFVYDYKPEPIDTNWVIDTDGLLCNAESIASFKPGTCYWKDSLISRFDE